MTKTAVEKMEKLGPPDTAISMIGLGVVESDAGFVDFKPSWVNVREAQFHKLAQRRQGKETWTFKRFGMKPESRSPEDLRRAHYREALNSLSTACKKAFDCLSRKMENQIRRQRSALVYFDAWGESSIFETPNSWRDAVSLDLLPKAIAREYGVSAFSCKLRGERSGFLQGLRVAADVLNSGEVDTVLLFGIFRAFPGMVLSEASSANELHGRAKTHLNSTINYSIERSGCVILRKDPGAGISLNVSDYFLLPENTRRARKELTERWRVSTGEDTASVYAGMHPSSEMQALESDAFDRLEQNANYFSICDMYGDSACLNPMLALSHLHSTGPLQQRRHALISADDGQAGIWLIECWSGADG
ncbi:hypothetical protein [Paraburkholderia sp.]|uniref:hypothetical protein n=1 Tax=Paraburkholderia sp. TaxID=1926495 RepID=UPI0025E66021|nr:hypothetical protein [Paraburkholderia sp.]